MGVIEYRRKWIMAGVCLLVIGAGACSLRGGVLIGFNRMEGGYGMGWRCYDYAGSEISNSRVSAANNVYRYLSGLSVVPGSGFSEVTGLYTRSDLSNQVHYLRTWRITDGVLLSSLAGVTNSFMSNSLILHHDGCFVGDGVGGVVYGYAVNKKPGYQPWQAGYGVLVDDAVDDGVDYGPYYETTDSNVERRGMAYDEVTQHGYVSVSVIEGSIYDSIEVYQAGVDTSWNLIGTVTVPGGWDSDCHIMAMAVGPDYNNDGDNDLFVLVQHEGVDGGASYNHGYDFWTVLDVAVGDDMSVTLTQVSLPYTIEPSYGIAYSIGVDPSVAVGSDTSIFTCEQLLARQISLEGDFNGDCRVDMMDLAEFGNNWLMVTDAALVPAAVGGVSSASSGGAGSVLSWDHELAYGAGRMLLVGVLAEDISYGDLEITGVTYGGVAMTLVAGSEQMIDGIVKTSSAIYYVLESDLPEDGVHGAVVTTEGTVSQILAMAMVVENAKQEVPGAVVNTSSVNSIATTMMGAGRGDMVVDFVGSSNGGSFSASNTEMEVKYQYNSGYCTAGSAVRPVEIDGDVEMAWEHSQASGTALVHSVMLIEANRP